MTTQNFIPSDTRNLLPWPDKQPGSYRVFFIMNCVTVGKVSITRSTGRRTANGKANIRRKSDDA